MLEPLAYLLMRKKLADIQSGFAPFHSFDEAIFFLEVSRDHILYGLIKVAALLGRPL